MLPLKHILNDISISETIGESTASIQQIVFDSRKVSKGDLFVAIKGTQSDGHRFIEMALDKGAIAIVCETLPEQKRSGITYLKVPDSAEAMGRMAANFYDHPSRQLKLIGVTGTNGKTSTVTMLYRLFTDMGYKTGLLSTVENRIGAQVVSATHTTPDSVAIQLLLADMVDVGCDFAFMEVSSHAIDQRRIAGLTFAGGVFTNLSHDHLDDHKTFKAYLSAKKRFFDELPENAFALTNIDDRNGRVMVQNTKASTKTYSVRTLADFKAKIIDDSLMGLHLDIDGHEFFARLIGTFNAYNLLAVYAVAVLLEFDPAEVLVVLSQVKTAEGRFDYLVDPNRQIVAVVDYAHTPDALEKVLSTIAKIRKGNEQVITVVGCGGDRDRAKRPLMAKVACVYSDQVIFTSDNPRSEDPEVIIEEMEAGIPITARNKVLSITDRRQAIKTACKLAKVGDIVLVAGKGHEKYQEIKGTRHPFDDKEVLKDALGL